MKKAIVLLMILLQLKNVSFSQSSKLPEFKFYSGELEIPIVAFKVQNSCRVDSYDSNEYNVKNADIVFHLKNRKDGKETLRFAKSVGNYIVNLKSNPIDVYMLPTYDSLGNLLSVNPEKLKQIKANDISNISEDLKPGDLVEFKNIIAIDIKTKKTIKLNSVVYTLK